TEGLEEYAAAMKVNPKEPRATMAKVSTLVQQNKRDEAVKFLQAGIAADSSNVQLITALGTLYLAKNETAKAEAEFTRALKIDERYVPARSNLARTLIAEKKEAEAVSQYQRIVA